jgi:hypothetical protein
MDGCAGNMNPWVQGKPCEERSHPPLNRINDWLFGGPSHTAAVTGAIHPPARMIAHQTIIRRYTGIFFILITFLSTPQARSLYLRVNVQENIDRFIVKTPAVQGIFIRT